MKLRLTYANLYTGETVVRWAIPLARRASTQIKDAMRDCQEDLCSPRGTTVLIAVDRVPGMQ